MVWGNVNRLATDAGTKLYHGRPMLWTERSKREDSPLMLALVGAEFLDGVIFGIRVDQMMTLSAEQHEVVE
jgi:hypothetical protein